MASPAEDQGAQLTQALAAQQKRFEKAQGPNREAQLNRLLDLAAERQAHLAELMESDPGQLFRVFIPESERRGMPEAVQDMLLQKVEIQGELQTVYEDFEDGSHRLGHFLKTALGERFELHFTDGHPDVPTGTGATVQGLSLDASATGGGYGEVAASVDSLVTAECCTGSETSSPPPAGAYTFGEQKTLVMLVNFQDKAEQPFTIPQVESTVFGSTSNFYLENSAGQTWLSGDVVGWYTLPMDSTICDYWALATNANNAATAAGINLDSYDRLVYAFPENACGWTGLGTVGGLKSRAWLNGYVTTYLAGHELGHNLGLGHSMGLDCGSDIIEGSDCYRVGYANRLDIMGSPNPGHFNAFQKDRLGWLGEEIQTINASGSYSLIPYAGNTSGIRALKIWQGQDASSGEDQWYYIEFRQDVGLDSFISNSVYVDSGNVLNGVVVNRGIPAVYDSSRLLDMNPGSSESNIYDFNDPALEVGRQFSDSGAGITIATTAASSSQATVSVTVGASACSPASPILSLSPEESPWVTAGTAVTYTVTVTNVDSESCGASNFSLSANPPSGWSATFADSTLSLAPGAIGTTSLTVTSATGATDGFYDIAVTAANGGYSATATVTYVVDNPTTPNSSPVAVSDGTSTEEGTAVTIKVLTNDYDPDGDALIVANLSGLHGSGVINADNTVTFTPPSGFSGEDTFFYTIEDGNGGTDTAEVSVIVNPSVSTTNQAPVAVNDATETSKGESVTIAVLANDYDPDGDSLTVTDVTEGARGTVTINGDGTLTYSAHNSFKSWDSFSYTVSDGDLSATAVVYISETVTASPSDTNNKGSNGKGPNK